MNKSKTNMGLAVICLVIWLGLVYGIQPETGWVHLALAAAAAFVARAIILSDPDGAQ